MNAVSELISNHRKLVRDVACLAAEGRLFQTLSDTITFVCSENSFSNVIGDRGTSNKYFIYNY